MAHSDSEEEPKASPGEESEVSSGSNFESDDSYNSEPIVDSTNPAKRGRKVTRRTDSFIIDSGSSDDDLPPAVLSDSEIDTKPLFQETKLKTDNKKMDALVNGCGLTMVSSPI